MNRSIWLVLLVIVILFVLSVLFTCGHTAVMLHDARLQVSTSVDTHVRGLGMQLAEQSLQYAKPYMTKSSAEKIQPQFEKYGELCFRVRKLGSTDALWYEREDALRLVREISEVHGFALYHWNHPYTSASSDRVFTEAYENRQWRWASEVERALSDLDMLKYKVEKANSRIELEEIQQEVESRTGLIEEDLKKGPPAQKAKNGVTIPNPLWDSET